MKAKDFSQFLEGFADLVSERMASDWQKLAAVFSLKPAATVAEICKSLQTASVADVGSANIQYLTHSLRQLGQVLAQHSKKTLLSDLKGLADALQPHSGASLDELIEVTRKNLAEAKATKKKAKATSLNVRAVEYHLRRLETALGDDAGFTEAFEALTADAAIKVPEAKQLARDFAKESATSKAKALKLIWGRHASLMQARAKGEATAGRTAA